MSNAIRLTKKNGSLVIERAKLCGDEPSLQQLISKYLKQGFKVDGKKRERRNEKLSIK